MHILVLAANPEDMPQIRLDLEVSRIRSSLLRAQKEEKFKIIQRRAARPIDVRRAMLDFDPNIVHFCGHGEGKEGIAFLDEDGLAKFVNADTLKDFFRLFADKVECVVLNACSSDEQAEAIAGHIPFVIGMKKAIGDEAAINFAMTFYDALGAGRSYEFAFELARNAITWDIPEEGLTPVLYKKQTTAQSDSSQGAGLARPISPSRGSVDFTKGVAKSSSGSRRIESTIPFDWVTIPQGIFFMGSDMQNEWEENELDLHPVNLPEFVIARYPVTVAQFRRFVDATNYKTTAEKENGARDLVRGPTRDDWPYNKEAYWEQPHGAGSRARDLHPVTCISWEDACEFCGWAGVRLPSEAEWEKAARGTEGRLYPWGNEPPDEERCNFNLNVGDTTPVDAHLEGATPDYGVEDLAGNVWEWTSSLFMKYPYVVDERENPQTPGERVLRGGSFYTKKAKNLRCAHRIYHHVKAVVSDYGFRVCATNEDQEAGQ